MSRETESRTAIVWRMCRALAIDLVVLYRRRTLSANAIRRLQRHRACREEINCRRRLDVVSSTWQAEGDLPPRYCVNRKILSDLVIRKANR